VLNEMHGLYSDPRVELRTGACVRSLDVQGDSVLGVRYTNEDREELARGAMVALGANAVFNAHILLASGLSGGELGQGLVEQRPAAADVMLEGMDNFQGGTSITGHGYMLYDGAHRRERAAALMETWNVPRLRDERGKWRRRLVLKFVFEDLRDPASRVELDPGDPARPRLRFAGHSAYSQRGIDALSTEIAKILAALPVERHEVHAPARATEAHILGTTVMGSDPATSVVDANLVHHKLRNLFVLGGSVFPTAAPANPTLTICALSLRAARKALGSR
jgi:choline dehydrogenase-like flavoprotein